MTDGTFRSALDRMLSDAYEQMARDLPTSDGPPLTVSVQKMTGFLPMSVDQLYDVGAITEEEARAQGWTPPPPPSRRDRLRWRWQAWRERTGRKIGGWVAGVDLSERDEDW